MKFTKMHGLGNDFIVVDDESRLPENASDLAIELCNRNFGIGADGLVYILPSDRADFQMRIINSDGTEAQQCGNAIRCVAKYVYDHKKISKQSLTIETIGAGVQQVELFIKNDIVTHVCVDMGEPVLEGLNVPTTIDKAKVINESMFLDEYEFKFTAVSMGNPHCVIFEEDIASCDIVFWGRKIEVNPLFPQKINVEFVSVISENHLEMRVWERGVGPTLACGTGACASLVSAVLNGLSKRKATVSLKGGDLDIYWNEENNHVYMTGSATEVYQGEF